MNSAEKVGIAALAAVAIGAIYVALTTKPAPTPAVVPAGTPATTLTKGSKYTIVAMVPAGITDQTSLTNALTAAGWTGVSVGAFQADSGYEATATWGGATGPVPAGVVAVAA